MELSALQALHAIVHKVTRLFYMSASRRVSIGGELCADEFWTNEVTLEKKTFSAGAAGAAAVYSTLLYHQVPGTISTPRPIAEGSRFAPGWRYREGFKAGGGGRGGGGGGGGTRSRM